MAVFTRVSVGSTPSAKTSEIYPSRPIRYLWKFQRGLAASEQAFALPAQRRDQPQRVQLRRAQQDRDVAQLGDGGVGDADDLLDDVLQRDDAARAAELVHDDREVEATRLHLPQELADLVGLRDEEDRAPDDPIERAVRLALAAVARASRRQRALQDAEEILRVDGCPDLIDAVAIDGASGGCDGSTHPPSSGSGTTTLGRALAGRLALAHFDTDDFYWLPTDPPYQAARPMPDRLQRLEAALDAGAENVESGEEIHEIVTSPDDFAAVRDALDKKFGGAESARLSWRPTVTTPVPADQAETLFGLIEALEDNDDVQTVSANYEVADEVVARLSA